jgi:hypothetical protein
MRGFGVVLACLLIVATPGCGGGSEEDEARDVVKEYIEAVADSDEEKVCDTLSENTRKQFDESKIKCEDAYKTFGRALTSEQKDKLNDLDPEVKVDGTEATTKVDEPPFEGTLRLKKEGDEWKVRSQ